MSSISVTNLTAEHLPQAAALAAEAYEGERLHVPVLPERPTYDQEIAAALTRWLGRAPGVAAMHGDRLVGYLIGIPVPKMRGRHRGIYVAEWANGAAGTNRDLVYRYMHEALSEKWVANGCMTHAVSVYSHDQEALDAWFWSSFGLLVVDAVRDLSPLKAQVPPGIEIRKATVDDLDEVVRIRVAQQRYMARPPIFMPLLEFEAAKDRREFLENPANALFLATRGGRAVAYIQWEPEGHGTARAVHDPGTVAITGAYTEDEYRRGGIGAALLGTLVDQAKQAGYRRVSVDFESFNIYGSRFWLKHFTPVCYSVIRYLDDRILWAGKDRPTSTASSPGTFP